MVRWYCRLYQAVYRVGATLLPWRTPKLLEGEGSLGRLPGLLTEKGIASVLLVTDKGIRGLGLIDDLLVRLSEQEIRVIVYDDTVANPTIDNIEEALQVYRTNACKAIIAVGGGSSMDCAKGVGARVARPKKSIPQMKGQFKVLKRLPLLIAVPTTAGTGSETTVAAVITNSKTHEKYAINDLSLIPHYAVLDPVMTVKLPPSITATTGIDALTHAVEAYMGRSNTEKTIDYAKTAIKLIFENLLEAYQNGENLEARERMQKASFLAGAAFTRAYVGNVHAIAHTLGGFYGVPHGLANSVILPYVLSYYGSSISRPLAELADEIGITEPTDTVDQKAKRFRKAIKELEQQLNIPKTLPGIIREEDLPLMIKRALQEANPLYPVPVIFGEEDMKRIYQMVRGE